MKTEQVTRYIADDGKAFDSQYDCEKHEELLNYWKQYEQQGCPKAILSKLKYQLDECMNVWEGTIATCSFDALRKKRMVKICQDFVENYKVYLTVY